MSRFMFRIWDKSNLKMYNKAIVGNFPETVPMVLVEANWVHIEPKVCEVMQCTGIKDINKQFIYEGDICEVTYCNFNGEPYDNFLIREVKWKNSSYRLCENYCGTELSSSLTTKDIFSVKVIGNIYEGIKDEFYKNISKC